ncbi:hypothetical protein NA57DRAFT_72920 [Rhizodiscina lignyota]|uniref:Heterokaryon incompatibility domain-containing protein n=1 Tax=Rhizodiscina lignyota TaxID=1504668 RepID=A0A9P4IK64_9PEZI|nr:hypothetical protein NA57DRAFT_72920 [Rhizodiscina lignyota]
MTECERGKPELFKHKPLQHPWQLRLIQLLPRDETGTVKGRIHFVPGGDAKQIDPNYGDEEEGKKVTYVALSYTWGDSTDKRDIELDGKTFFVTANLYEFLCLVTLHNGTVGSHFWIDAICIDQTNIKERNAQIGRMTAIYEHADIVNIWLGSEAENSNLAMVGLAILAGEITVSKAFPEGSSKALVIASSADTAVSEPGWGVVLDQKFMRAVTDLLQRAWWTRVWVIQESTVPDQKYVMLCGSILMSWGDVGRATDKLQRLISEFPELEHRRSSFFNLSGVEDPIRKIRRLRKSAPYETKLLDLVSLGRDFDASDSRDHIYAFLGMMGSKPLPFLDPDYENPVKTVYQDFTKYLISTCSYGHKLDVLGHASNASAKTPSPLRLFDDMEQLRSMGQNLLSRNTAIPKPELDSVLKIISRVQPRMLEILRDPQFSRDMDDMFPPSVHSRLYLASTLNVDNLRKSAENARSTIFADRKDDSHENMNDEQLQAQRTGELEHTAGVLAQDKPLVESGPVSIPDITQTPVDWLRVMGVKSSMPLNFDSFFKEPTTETTHSSPQESPPSWVPIWDRPRRLIPLCKYFGQFCDAENSAYSASGSDQAPFLRRAATLFEFSGHELKLRGFRVDIIKHLDRLIFSDIHAYAEPDEKVWAKMQDLVNTGTYEATNERMVDALWRTVLADVVYERGTPVRRLGRRMEDISDQRADNDTGVVLDRSACSARSLARTAGDLIALVPRLAEVDDEVFLLAGGQVLYVLRPLGDCFQYIGECYLHGYMDGEALRRLEDGTAKVDTIRIV